MFCRWHLRVHVVVWYYGKRLLAHSDMPRLIAWIAVNMKVAAHAQWAGEGVHSFTPINSMAYVYLLFPVSAFFANTVRTCEIEMSGMRTLELRACKNAFAECFLSSRKRAASGLSYNAGLTASNGSVVENAGPTHERQVTWYVCQWLIGILIFSHTHFRCDGLGQVSIIWWVEPGQV